MQDRVIHRRCAFALSRGTVSGIDVQYRWLARDIGTVLVGRDAVAEGLIDAVGGLDLAVQRLRQAFHPPEEIGTGPALGPGMPAEARLH